MEHEEKGMKPLLASHAATRVHEFILGNEDARDYREGSVEGQRGAARRLGQGHAVANEHAQGVDRMANSLPMRQPTLAMEMEFVDEHERCLNEQRYAKDQRHRVTLRMIAPQRVSPGPNARLTMVRPAAICVSRRSSIQTWGSVAEDMLPRSSRIFLLQASCASSRRNTSRARSRILGPPGCTAYTAWPSSWLPRPARCASRRRMQLARRQCVRVHPVGDPFACPSPNRSRSSYRLNLGQSVHLAPAARVPGSHGPSSLRRRRHRR